MMRFAIGFAVLCGCLLLPVFPAESSGCTDPKYKVLDYWLGEWNVYSNGNLVGTNRIEQILSGCAILEHWRDAEGSEGKSLFYFDLGSGSWKQVWVTDNGSMKEKSLKFANPDRSVLFQGEVTVYGGKRILDRTTLTPVGSNVRQLIEHSTDGGKTWRAVFDGEYRRKVDPSLK